MAYSKTIGITGASGFIGSYLSKELSKDYKLHLFGKGGNKSTEDNQWNNKNLFETNKGDFKEVDVLIHFAGTPSSKDSFEKNFLLTKHVLRCCVDAGVKEFYLASSYAVYGDRKTPATVEDSLNPFDEYALSKVMSEYLLKKEIINNNIEGKVLRLCSIYGEGGKGLLSIVKSKISNKEKVSFDSIFKRNYLYIEDLVHYIREIVDSEDTEIFHNISGETMSTLDIKNILQNHEISCESKDLIKPSFLCLGDNKFRKKVEDYLFG